MTTKSRPPRARRSRGRLAAALIAAAAIAAPAAAQTSPAVAPFAEPPFAGMCTVHRFDEGEPPPIEGIPDDPLCVEYQKRDITASNGGAVRFLAAEPARFAAAIPKCRYWQQDHWSVQLDPATPSLVRWDGSYWFDKGSGVAAGRLRNFSIAGVPASVDQAATAVEPIDADLAALIRGFGDGTNGGGGATVCLGAAPDPACPAGDADARRCGEGLGDPCAVAAARAAAAERCDCASATSPGAHARCVSQSADEDVAAGRLPARCRGAVVDCARRSTCGRAGAVTCCRTLSSGRSSCSVKRRADTCRAPRGGTACLGARASCCDACTPTSCP
ncbi:MAG TPA: hypothetical protein VFD92_16375 [Candidatus Binatia bacterium]|nr:hypothetical protein [Candidatus Binatia bacterium]